MSQPPTNSPLMYTCGTVGHSLKSLTPCRSGVLEDIVRAVLSHTFGCEDLNHRVAEPTLRGRGNPLHVHHDVIGLDVLLNTLEYRIWCLGVACGREVRMRATVHLDGKLPGRCGHGVRGAH